MPEWKQGHINVFFGQISFINNQTDLAGTTYPFNEDFILSSTWRWVATGPAINSFIIITLVFSIYFLIMSIKNVYNIFNWQ